MTTIAILSEGPGSPTGYRAEAGAKQSVGKTAGEAALQPLRRVAVPGVKLPDRLPRGLTGGSRALPVGGSALHEASLKIIDKGRQIAANLLEASSADIEFGDGEFKIVGTDRKVDLFDVAKAAQDPARLPPGKKREMLLRQARASEMAVQIDRWISSPGLRPPE